ncbi:MAG TPA: hypothetical protein VFK02_27300 [Kofleriaceae bacterium]|nr:hypothetical protein [Kofleriaceae bacterium]
MISSSVSPGTSDPDSALPPERTADGLLDDSFTSGLLTPAHEATPPDHVLRNL